MQACTVDHGCQQGRRVEGNFSQPQALIIASPCRAYIYPILSDYYFYRRWEEGGGGVHGQAAVFDLLELVLLEHLQDERKIRRCNTSIDNSLQKCYRHNLLQCQLHTQFLDALPS